MHLLALILAFGWATIAQIGPSSGATTPSGETCRTLARPEWSRTGAGSPEAWAWRQICEGKTADFNRRYSVPPLDPRGPEGWDETRRLSPAFLETILLDETFSEAIPSHGVHVVGAWFDESLDLSKGRIRRQLRLEESRFERTVDFSELKIDQDLSLDGSAITSGLYMNRLKVGGSLLMERAEFGQVDLLGAKVDGRLITNGSRFMGRLNMSELTVGRSLWMKTEPWFEQRTTFHEVDLSFAKVDGNLEMVGASFSEYLDMDSVKVGRHLYMRSSRKDRNRQSKTDIPASFKEVYMAYAEVGGQLDMTGAQFAGKLVMPKLTVEADLLMNNSRFDRDLQMEGLDVGGDLLMSEGNFARVDMLNAKVGGLLQFDGSTISDELDLNGVEVGGSLFMRSVTKDPDRGIDQDLLASFAAVDLSFAKVQRNLEMDGARGSGGLNLDSVHVGQHLFMRSMRWNSGEEAAGEIPDDFADVYLGFATVGGNVDVRGSQFSGHLDLNKVTIGAHLIMTKDAELASVDLRGAEIGGLVSMFDSTFRGKLNLESATIGIGLRLASTKGVPARWERDARLVLRNAHVGAVRSGTADAWPSAPGSLELDGFTYDRFGSYTESDTTSDITDSSGHNWFEKWLATDNSYSPQPYHQLARVLRASGLNSQANHILYAGRERERHEADWPKQLGMTMLKVTIGYGLGYGYFWSLLWVAGFVALGTFVIRQADKPATKGLAWTVACSFDLLLPVVELNKAHGGFVMETLGQARDTAWVKYYFYLHHLVGWVLGSFLIAALAGLTQQ